MAGHGEQRKRPHETSWGRRDDDDLEHELARALGEHEPQRALNELVEQLVRLSRESVRDARIAARRAANAERLAVVAIAIAAAAIIAVLV